MKVTKKIVFIKDWILNYVNSMPKKADSLVIGISGGIDSAVTSTLCAMTGCRTIVVTMPIHQNPDETDRGMQHCSWLNENYDNIEVLNIDLTDVYNQFINSFLPDLIVFAFILIMYLSCNMTNGHHFEFFNLLL